MCGNFVDDVEPTDLIAAAAAAAAEEEGSMAATRLAAAAVEEAVDADADASSAAAGSAAAGPRVRMLTEQVAFGGVVAASVTLEGVMAAAEMLAGWLTDARAEASDGSSGASCSTFSFCTTCGFTLPCPWGC